MSKRKTNRQQIINAFGGECSICGFKKCASALEFHHRDPKKKEMEISKFAGNSKLTYKQIRELESCILVCSNCHRCIHSGMYVEEIENIPETELLEFM
jgi:predicted HNH restriction endonuclease